MKINIKVMNQSSQIGIGHIVLTLERNQVVDYTTPLYTNNLHLISPKPSPLDPYTNFLRPFSEEVWYFVLLSFMAVITASSAIIISMSKLQLFQNNNRKNLSDNSLVHIKILLGKGKFTKLSRSCQKSDSFCV